MKARMKREKRSRHIKIYFTEAEYEEVMEPFRETTCRSKAEYGRKLLMNKPVAVTYRCRSIDDVIEVVNGIRRLMEDVLGHAGFTQTDKDKLNALFKGIDGGIYQLSNLCIQLLDSGKVFTESSTTTNEK